MIGLILKRRYCILERLGKGGQGSVYLARDLELGGLWAVKELPLERKREAKLLRMLEHPALPRMVDYLEKGDCCYLVMEYIRGSSLQKWMDEGRCFSEEEVIKYARTICQILKYLHHQKPPVFYGDLKPENLILTESGQLYLVDLGAAMAFYGKEPEKCLGTRGYAAPEQYEGRISAASDIYGLGKVMRALLGKSGWKQLLKRPELAVLIWRCTIREPEHRPADIGRVEAALERMSLLQKRKGSYAAAGMTVGVLFILLSGAGAQLPVETALTEITEEYYAEAFLQGSGVREICKKAETGLQKLLKEYPDATAQRRLLLLLACNGELQGEMQRTALYYEQLLLYDPEFQEGYKRYCGFLRRQGQEQQAEKLAGEWEQRRRTGEKASGNIFTAVVHAMELGGFDVQVGVGENGQIPEEWALDFDTEPETQQPAGGPGQTGETQQPAGGPGQTGETQQQAGVSGQTGETQQSAGAGTDQKGGWAALEESGMTMEQEHPAVKIPEEQERQAAFPELMEQNPPREAEKQLQSEVWKTPGITALTCTPSPADEPDPTDAPVVTEISVTTAPAPSESLLIEETPLVSITERPLVPAYYLPDLKAGKKEGLKICYFETELADGGEIHLEIQGSAGFYPLSVRTDGREVSWKQEAEGISTGDAASAGTVLQLVGVHGETENVEIYLK